MAVALKSGITLTNLALRDPEAPDSMSCRAGGPLVVSLKYETTRRLPATEFELRIYSTDGTTRVATLRTGDRVDDVEVYLPGGTIDCVIPALPLKAGAYYLGALVRDLATGKTLAWWDGETRLHVSDSVGADSEPPTWTLMSMASRLGSCTGCRAMMCSSGSISSPPWNVTPPRVSTKRRPNALYSPRSMLSRPWSASSSARRNGVTNATASQVVAARPQLLAELRFIRALWYFTMVRAYGGIPILTDQLIYDLSGDLTTVQMPRPGGRARDRAGQPLQEVQPISAAFCSEQLAADRKQGCQYREQGGGGDEQGVSKIGWTHEEPRSGEEQRNRDEQHEQHRAVLAPFLPQIHSKRAHAATSRRALGA